MSTRMEQAAVTKCVELTVIESETNRRLLDRPAAWLTPWGCQNWLLDHGWEFKAGIWRLKMQPGDRAGYNGMVFFYCGTITQVYPDNLATMYNNTLGWVTTDKWEWDPQNKRWWCDIALHAPDIRNHEKVA